MSRMFFVLLVLAVISASTLGQQCGVNEEFKTCGTACEPRCNEPPRVVCTFDCKIGCQCKEGYLRNSAGSCVAPSDC